MKRKLNLFLTTSFLLSSSTSVLAFVIDTNNISTNNFTNGNVDPETATKYANETSIVGKALLIGKNKSFNTNDLLNIMYSQNHATDINNLTAGNTGNDFINVWTNKLDGNSINAIQSLFQRNGINQPTVNAINANITNYRNYCSILPQIKKFLKNSVLSNDNIVDSLKNIKDIVPNIDNYLSYVNYIPVVTTSIQQLLTDWDQETNFTGNTTLQKMENYMAKKATFAQAWNIPKNKKWYYVKDRAGKWNWNQFYQYIAGANFNYLFKLVSGKYLGEMITDNITYTLGIPSGFNVANFNTTISASLDKILTNSEAWPYLIKIIIPILKSEVLKLTNPTLGIDSITWDDKTLIKNNTIQLKEVLTVFQKLISSKNDLLKLVTNLMTGPFGEDIITKITVAWTDSYWTLPEIQDKFSFISAISDIPKQVVNNLETTIKQVPINDTINKIFDFTNKYLTINPVIDLQDLSTYLKLTFGSNDFIKALNNLKYIIEHPTNNNSKAKEILAMLGVQFNGETSFKEGSVLASLSNWLKTPTSSLNSLLNIIANKTQNGIINNMLIEQENLYKDMYSKYFDLDNSTYFTLNNIVMNKFVNDDGRVSVILSYQIKNNLDNKSYDITFKNDNFLTTKDFKITLFMLENYN